MEHIYHLRNYFDKLLPCLLQGLKFTELDRANQDDAESIENEGRGMFMEGSEEQEEEPEEDKQEQRNFFDRGMHTLRKICGQTFEKLSLIFGGEIFERLKERILLCLASNDWKIREIGLLVIGAISKGCREAIENHLKELIPYFTQCLESNNNNKWIRSNALWTLSRFTSWLLNQSQSQPQILQDYIKLILRLTLDNEKTVQESACTALAVLISREEGQVDNYLVEIFQFLKPVYESYTGRSLKVLYDMTGLFADRLSHKLQEKQLQEIILPIIMNKWKTTPSMDSSFAALFDCANSILRALDTDAKVYMEVFVARDMQLIAEYLEYMRNKSRKFEFQKRELCVRAIDQLSVMLSILRVEFEQVLKNSKLLDLIAECLQSGDFQVRQFSLSFVGELCKMCPPAFVGKSELVLKLLAKFLILPTDPDKESSALIVCNNACWAICELIGAYPSEIAQHLGDLAQRFIELLITKTLDPTLAYNLATAIGRVALYQPKAVAPYLSKITKNWCVAMSNQMVDLAKIEAFKGFFLAINDNPEGILQDFAFLCVALLMFKHTDQELELASKNLIQNVKKLSGSNWDAYFKNFPPNLQEDLKAKYGV